MDIIRWTIGQLQMLDTQLATYLDKLQQVKSQIAHLKANPSEENKKQLEVLKIEAETIEKPTPPPQRVESATSPPSGGAFLQAGAFSQEKNAQAMVDTLRRFGYNAVIERASGMYRVRVYGFSSLEEAKKAAAKLRSQGIECFAGK